ncbi:transposase (fragment) [Carnobacterium maltaromaticum]
MNECGIKVNQNKIRRIMHKLGLKGLQFTRKYNSYKETVGRVAKNRINRRFITSVPHQKTTKDTSDFKDYEQGTNGKYVIKNLYLYPFLYLFNREVLSYRIKESAFSGYCIQTRLLF